jgi:hypothetical protein
MSTLVGLRIRLERTIEVLCTCGETAVVCGSSSGGPHLASLRCQACDAHRGWLSRSSGEFLLAAIDRFGRPREPIIVRNSATSSGADAAASPAP